MPSKPWFNTLIPWSPAVGRLA